MRLINSKLSRRRVSLQGVAPSFASELSSSSVLDNDEDEDFDLDSYDPYGLDKLARSRTAF